MPKFWNTNIIQFMCEYWSGFISHHPPPKRMRQKYKHSNHNSIKKKVERGNQSLSISALVTHASMIEKPSPREQRSRSRSRRLRRGRRRVQGPGYLFWILGRGGKQNPPLKSSMSFALVAKRENKTLPIKPIWITKRCKTRSSEMNNIQGPKLKNHPIFI